MGTIEETIRQIKRAPICEPVEGEYVDRCHWSKTGWAIWSKDAGCSCRPARPPALTIGQ